MFSELVHLCFSPKVCCQISLVSMLEFLAHRYACSQSKISSFHLAVHLHGFQLSSSFLFSWAFRVLLSFKTSRLAERCCFWHSMPASPEAVTDRLDSLEFSVAVLQHVRNQDHAELSSAVNALALEVEQLQSRVLRLEAELDLLRFLVHYVLSRAEDTDSVAPFQPSLDSLD